jgi:hypothetical protein
MSVARPQFGIHTGVEVDPRLRFKELSSARRKLLTYLQNGERPSGLPYSSTERVVRSRAVCNFALEAGYTEYALAQNPFETSTLVHDLNERRDRERDNFFVSFYADNIYGLEPELYQGIAATSWILENKVPDMQLEQIA